MRIQIEKAARRLTLFNDGDEILLTFPIALGQCPVGPKEKEGDGKTPEGRYFVCLKKIGKYGPALGVSYPGEQDARRVNAPEEFIACIRKRVKTGERPPWGSALGGEIYIHGGGTATDWTAGCIALNDSDALALYDMTPLGTQIDILP
ncbi:MAG: L,D-transpeptidase [Clostridia bacterium]|nr:L,D-transpeptidase [Clostridia bacterium]